MERRIEKLEERVRFIDKMLFAALALGAALGLGGSFVWKSFSEVQNRIDAMKSELELTRGEVDDARQDLKSTRTELETVQDQLRNSNVKIIDAQNTLGELEVNASRLKDLFDSESKMIDVVVEQATTAVLEQAAKVSPEKAREAIDVQLVEKVLRDLLEKGVDTISTTKLSARDITAEKIDASDIEIYNSRGSRVGSMYASDAGNGRFYVQFEDGSNRHELGYE